MYDISRTYDLTTRWETHVNSVACDCFFSCRHSVVAGHFSLCSSIKARVNGLHGYGQVLLT